MERYWEQLKNRQLEDGGFQAAESQPKRADATAWGAIVLAARRDEARAQKAAERLRAQQLDDGRVPVLATHREAAWVTPLAAIAWLAAGHDEPARRALDFLAGYSGRHFERPEGTEGHDTSIPGWPWIDETHSWVEPTALSVLAFRLANRADHPRVAEALRLLADRQLPAGGWNYGNTFTFGAEMRPTADSTGIVLSVLPESEGNALEGSLSYLAEAAGGVRTPLSLGWAILGLSARGRRPADADSWVLETLDRQTVLGEYSTTELALLLAAAHCQRGLFEALAGVTVDG